MTRSPATTTVGLSPTATDAPCGAAHPCPRPAATSSFPAVTPAASRGGHWWGASSSRRPIPPGALRPVPPGTPRRRPLARARIAQHGAPVARVARVARAARSCPHPSPRSTSGGITPPGGTPETAVGAVAATSPERDPVRARQRARQRARFPAWLPGPHAAPSALRAGAQYARRGRWTGRLGVPVRQTGRPLAVPTVRVPGAGTSPHAQVQARVLPTAPGSAPVRPIPGVTPLRGAPRVTLRGTPLVQLRAGWQAPPVSAPQARIPAASATRSVPSGPPPHSPAHHSPAHCSPTHCSQAPRGRGTSAPLPTGARAAQARAGR